jgi:hypothetical protein
MLARSPSKQVPRRPSHAPRRGVVPLVLAWLLAFAAPLPALADLADLAADLARTLDRRHGLAGERVQVAENRFWQRRTRLNLPFSAPLREALAAALSARGALVTVSAPGAEPLVLVGTYDEEWEGLAVSVELRRYGATASEALAVAEGRLPLAQVEPAWLRPEFPRLARSLVRLLEMDYRGVNPVDVDVPEPRPALSGHPTLALAGVLREGLGDALAGAGSFLRPAPAVGPRGELRVRYALSDGWLSLAASVVGEDGRRLAAADMRVREAMVPAALRRPTASPTLRVGLHYRPRPGDEQAGSDAVRLLLDRVGALLGAHGITWVEGAGEVDRAVSLSVRLDYRPSYGFARQSAALAIAVRDATGRLLGRLDASAEDGPFADSSAGRARSARRLAESLLGEGERETLLRLVLGRR